MPLTIQLDGPRLKLSPRVSVGPVRGLPPVTLPTETVGVIPFGEATLMRIQ